MTSAPTPTIALLGTGTMGEPIGQNLIRAGFALRAWNRSSDKAKPLAEAGATVATSPAEAVDGAELVVTVLYDADAVAEVMQQARSGLKAGATWIQVSTVGVEGCQRLAELAAEYGLNFVDAPVLGTKQPAVEGKLVVLASGPDQARDRCQPVFEAIAARTLWVGSAGSGSKLKLVANAWVLAVVEGIAESLTLARELGLDPHLFLDAVAGGAMDAPYVQLKGKSMIEGDFSPSFGVSGAAKDGGLILAAAEQAGVDMAITRAAKGFLDRAAAAGHADDDLSATYLAERSG